MLDPHEETVLLEACRVADRLVQLRDVLAGIDLTDPMAVRLLAEERQQRTALAHMLLTKLGLPTGVATDGSVGSTPRSRRAQTAARGVGGRLVRRERRSGTGSPGLPSDLAAGPDPRLWGHGRRSPEVEWRAAGEAWSRAHGLDFAGWRELLDPQIRYAVSALGRAHRRHGGFRAPWERPLGAPCG